MFKFGQKKWIEKSFDDVTVKEKLQWRVVVDVDAAVNVVSDVAVVVVADAAVVDVVVDVNAAVIDVVVAVDDDDVLVVAL